MRDVLGAGDAFAPVAFGAFGLGSICGSVVGGQLADRVGRRSVMLAALLGSAAILLLISQITDARTFLAGVFLFAAVGETYRPAASAMIADVTTPAQRSHAFALMYVAINLGFAIGPAVGGEIARHSFQWLFFGDAATCAAFALIILFGIRETLGRAMPVTGPPETDAPADDPRGTSGPAELVSPLANDHAPDVPQVGFAAAARHMLRDATFLVICGASFFIALVYMQALSTFPLYLDALGFGTAQYGRIIAVNGLLIVVGQLPLTNWMQGKPRGHLLVVAATFTALGFGLKTVAFSELTFIGTVVIWTLGEMMQFPLLAPIVTELAPDNMRARYMGVFGMSFSGANTIGAPLGGVVLKYAGATTLWLGGAALALVAAALYATIRRRIAYPKETPASDP
jgi:MFS family permease